MVESLSAWPEVNPKNQNHLLVREITSASGKGYGQVVQNWAVGAEWVRCDVCVFWESGSQVKHGEETFVKVNKTYPLLCADIVIRNKIPHYLLVCSVGRDASSSFLHMRTKV